MASPLPARVPWDDLQVFLVLRRAGTFAAAARSLEVDATTVSRRLGRLERSLGTQLFQRTPDALVPTPEAESIVDTVEQMERHAARVGSQIAGRDALVEGVVRIAVTPQFARSYLFPRITPLCAQYPRLELQIVPSQSRADLTRDEADLALRFQAVGGGPPAESTSHVELQSRRLGSFPVGVYASREYVARMGSPKNAHALRGHDIVLPNEPNAPFPGRAWVDRVRSLGRASIRVDVASMGAAVSAGFGVGAIVDLYAEGFPNLVKLGPPAAIDARDLWILMPSDLVRVARVRVVWDFIVGLTHEAKPSPPPRRAGARARTTSPRATPR